MTPGALDPADSQTVPSVAGRRQGEGRKQRATSPRLVAVVVVVNVLALAVSLTLARHRVEDFWLGVALLSTLAALAGAGPVRIPSFKTSISTTDAFVFAALGGYGALPAVLVAGAGVVGSVLGRQPERRAIRMAFNVGNMMLSTAIAAAVYLWTGGVPGGAVAGQVGPLFIAVIVYVVVNTGMVALAVVLDSDRHFLATWIESARWAAVSASLGMTLAVGLLWAIGLVGTSGLALGIPPCWMLASFYRTHKQRQEFQQQRIQRIEGINEILEDRVAARTVELQRALSSIESANERLTQANERLTEANRAKSEFLANVSHELRTPLNAIIGFSELLSEPGSEPLTPNQSEFVRDIHESGDHLLGLINNILDVSKIEAGKMAARRICFPMPKAMSDAVSMLRPQAVQREVRLISDCATDVRFAELDPGMFRQLLVNLLSNAVKFTDAGGQVTARARRNGPDLTVQVQDTGIGIAPEHLERIFDEFYQVDGSYSRNYEGTGLGLALVRRMVELQGGSIEVESTTGVGSTFTCHFPGAIREALSAAPEPGVEPELELESGRKPVPGDRRAAVQTAAQPVTVARDGRTVLVVDLEAINRKLARNALRSRGYTVFEATTGEEALKLLRVKPVDLVLMDLQLPGLDGIEFARRITDDPLIAVPRVVGLTSDGSTEEQARARDAGCVGLIAKPVRLANLPGQVARFIAAEQASGLALQPSIV